MSQRVDDILDRIHRKPRPGQPAPSARDLLARYDQPEYRAEWEDDPLGPRLYRGFVRRLIDQGYPTDALKLARRRLDVETKPLTNRVEKLAAGDPVLRYLVALAFARGGNPGSALRYGTPLVEQVLAGGWVPPPGLDKPAVFASDVIALRGRLFKDAAVRAAPGPLRAGLAGQSADWYELAAERAGGTAYPLGNAATMRYVQGQPGAAADLANRAYARAVADRTADPANYWAQATAAEACLVLGRGAEAQERYTQAVDEMIGRRDRGSLAAVPPNLKLLSEAGLQFQSDWIAKQVGSVVVFSGHRVDPPGYAGGGRSPRFPDDPALIEAVREGIAAKLDEVGARFGICSLTSGADILFAEELMKRKGWELQVVLPFAEEDFVRLRVDYGRADRNLRWAKWRDRFRGVLAQLHGRPDAVYRVTEEPFLGSDRLYAYANEVLQGMAVVRARQLGVTPHAVVLWDHTAPPTLGGAAHFRELWKAATGRDATVIPLNELREAEAADPPDTPPPVEPPPELPRPIRAMLFADVAGFSRLEERYVPAFFKLFTATLAATLAEAGPAVRLQNTWGDGVFVVFAEKSDGTAVGEAVGTGVVQAAEFALRLVEAFDRLNDRWQEMGFADLNPLRVGVHAGPVFEMSPDPVLGRTSFFGQHVNRTARIEPITLPGTVFASEQFAAVLEVAAPGRFACEFVGAEPLAKGYATAPLYRLERPAGGAA